MKKSHIKKQATTQSIRRFSTIVKKSINNFEYEYHSFKTSRYSVYLRWRIVFYLCGDRSGKSSYLRKLKLPPDFFKSFLSDYSLMRAFSFRIYAVNKCSQEYLDNRSSFYCFYHHHGANNYLAYFPRTSYNWSDYWINAWISLTSYSYLFLKISCLLYIFCYLSKNIFSLYYNMSLQLSENTAIQPIEFDNGLDMTTE